LLATQDAASSASAKKLLVCVCQQLKLQEIDMKKKCCVVRLASIVFFTEAVILRVNLI